MGRSDLGARGRDETAQQLAEADVLIDSLFEDGIGFVSLFGALCESSHPPAA